MDTRSNLSSEYENDKVEVDDDNNVQNMSFDSIGSAISEMSLEDSNIPIWRRNKQDAKQLLGYLPILEAANKDLVRDTFHKSLRHLLEPIILLKDGIDLFINNENTWFYPRVSTIIADWPEAASFCLVYKSSNSSLPCHSCLIKRDNLANIDLSVNNVILRTHDEMRKYFENDTQKSVCIESVHNFFWDLP
ncbi:unnamed protein product [Rhizophagus irregularis]|nr:unnamed protein product [Rhizophagus irregularis]